VGVLAGDVADGSASGFVANGPEPTGVVQASRARLLDFGVGDGVIVRSVPKA